MPAFLDQNSSKYQEYFFIIDNTPFPLFKVDPFQPPHHRQLGDSSMTSNDVLVDVSFKTTYKVREEYTQLIVIGGAIIGGLLLLLGILVWQFKKHKRIYS